MLWAQRVAVKERVALIAELWALGGVAGSASAARSTLVGDKLQFPVLAAGGSGAALPSALALQVTATQWALVGEPVLGVFGKSALSADGATLPRGFPATHTVPLESSLRSPLAATIPSGALLPGYAYTASVALTLNASWEFGGSGAAGGWPGEAAGSPFVLPAGARVAVDDGVSGIVLHAARPCVLLAHAPPRGGVLR